MSLHEEAQAKSFGEGGQAKSLHEGAQGKSLHEEAQAKGLHEGAQAKSLLRVTGLSKSFGGVRAVSNVSFDVQAGELLALIGPNGAGKSTCFNMLNGQLASDAGSIVFEGRSITGMKPREVWRMGVGRTFQITATFASMTVRENVQVALLSHRMPRH